MRFLRSNTAVIITVGPFFDKGDGVTIETGLTITNERITLTADTDAGSAPTNILDNVTGATSGTANDLNYITGNDAGMMQLELAAADTNRVGRMFLSITDAANHVPVFHEFFVLPQVIYDWLTAGVAPLSPTVAGRTLDVTATGAAGVDWANVENPTTTVGLSGTTVKTATDVETDTADIQTRLPAALVSGRMDASVGAMATGVITEAAFDTTAGSFAPLGFIDQGTAQSATATTLVGRAALADDVIKAGMTLFARGSTQGYWQSVLIDSVSGDTFTIAAWPVTTPTGTITYKVAGTPNASAVSYAGLVDAVWDEPTSGHATAGTTGKALTDAGSAGDPWSTALPGAYGAGTAGKIVGDNVNATISSRATQTSVDTLDDFVDTEVSAIKTKTDFLPSATAGAAGGLFIAGTNAATTITTALTTTFTGNLTGSVASVTGAVGSLTTNNDKTGYSLTADIRIKKNTALANFTFLMVDSSDVPATGLTVTAERSLDGAALASMANAVSEISNGLYKISLAAADTNADICCYRFTASGAKDRVVMFPTQTE